MPQSCIVFITAGAPKIREFPLGMCRGWSWNPMFISAQGWHGIYFCLTRWFSFLGCYLGYLGGSYTVVLCCVRRAIHWSIRRSGRIYQGGSRENGKFIIRASFYTREGKDKDLAAEITSFNIKKNNWRGEPAITEEHIWNSSTKKSMGDFLSSRIDGYNKLLKMLFNPDEKLSLCFKYCLSLFERRPLFIPMER